MLIEKIKAALAADGKTQGDLAAYMKISHQGISNKFKRESITAYDLIKLAELTGSTLKLVRPDGIEIIFGMEDLNENGRNL